MSWLKQNGGVPTRAGSARIVRLVFVVLLGVAIFVAIAMGLQFFAVKLVGSQTPETAGSISDVRTSLIQLLGGIGVLGGFFYTARTFNLGRGTQRAQRFSVAVAALGNSDSHSVRAGGAYTMGMLVREDFNYWAPTEEVLSDFVREGPKHGDIGADISAAIRVLGSRQGRYLRRGRALDLRGAWLQGGSLVGMDLSRALLSGANLKYVDLSDAVLIGTQFVGADLQYSVLAGPR